MLDVSKNMSCQTTISFVIDTADPAIDDRNNIPTAVWASSAGIKRLSIANWKQDNDNQVHDNAQTLRISARNACWTDAEQKSLFGVLHFNKSSHRQLNRSCLRRQRHGNTNGEQSDSRFTADHCVATKDFQSLSGFAGSCLRSQRLWRSNTISYSTWTCDNTTAFFQASTAKQIPAKLQTSYGIAAVKAFHGQRKYNILYLYMNLFFHNVLCVMKPLFLED